MPGSASSAGSSIGSSGSRPSLSGGEYSSSHSFSSTVSRPSRVAVSSADEPGGPVNRFSRSERPFSDSSSSKPPRGGLSSRSPVSGCALSFPVPRGSSSSCSGPVSFCSGVSSSGSSSRRGGKKAGMRLKSARANPKTPGMTASTKVRQKRTERVRRRWSHSPFKLVEPASIRSTPRSTPPADARSRIRVRAGRTEAPWRRSNWAAYSYRSCRIKASPTWEK